MMTKEDVERLGLGTFKVSIDGSYRFHHSCLVHEAEFHGSQLEGKQVAWFGSRAELDAMCEARNEVERLRSILTAHGLDPDVVEGPEGSDTGY